MFNAVSTRQQAILTARQVLQYQPVFLDTETTGLERTDEIIEISVINHAGQTLVDSLVKPTQPVPVSATRIHGITDLMVQKAQAWPLMWARVKPLLTGKVIVAYNADFDLRMLQQSHERYRLAWRETLNMFDLMKLFAQFNADWDLARRSWRFISLDAAGKKAGIPLPNAHRSLADTLLTRALLNYIAEQT